MSRTESTSVVSRSSGVLSRTIRSSYDFLGSMVSEVHIFGEKAFSDDLKAEMSRLRERWLYSVVNYVPTSCEHTC